jgi:hypothetical protein
MIAKPSIAFSDFSGTAKEVTARNVNGRNILSLRAKQSSVVTPAQAQSRNTLSKISRAYKQLSDSEMTAWEVLASHLKGISTFGSPAQLTAHNAFVRINTNLLLVGEPIRKEAPSYTNDVPEVLYQDLWITPEMIIFTGLEQPSDSHVLVFKMSHALSPGVSSGWGKTVIISPGMTPDWGDADLTTLYTEVMGLAPEAGKKYFCEFYWLDKSTGFTGESMAISAVCKESSTAYQEEYVPRARFTQEDVTEDSSGEGLDFELSPGSAICSADAILHGDYNVASTTFVLKKAPKNFIEGKAMVLARGTAEGNYSPQTFLIEAMKWIGDYEISFKARAGHYVKPSEVHSTGVYIDR